MFFEQTLDRTMTMLLGFIDPTSRIYALYLVSALVLALVAYWQVEKAHEAEDAAGSNEPRTRTSFFKYVFDPKIWMHPSSVQDAKYFVVNAVVYYGLITQFLLGSHMLSFGFYELLLQFSGQLSAPLISGPASILLYTFVSVLALDFGVFLMHWLFHKIPVLWEFHKVHHSAEQLNPLTLFRMHPVDLAMVSVSVMFFQAVAFAGFFYLSGEQPQAYQVFGLNLVIFFFYVFGYNLRHSHIWLNYPVWLSRIFISPAQHQIHHSSDPKHFDHNMGLIFSFWDQFFGTHYIPRTYEKLTYGLSRKEPNPFNSVADIYLKPFVWAAGHFTKNGSGSAPRKSIVYAGLVATVAAALVGYSMGERSAKTVQTNLPSLKLEELTWTEVHRAINNGFKTIIIPTGGIEQGGPFVALGKHNWVVDFTTQKIASQLGNTLVAPVMKYVPEGKIEPVADGHMTFAGTISLKPDLFEQVLIAAARSLKHHGFTEIYFVGDSGWNQNPQSTVAKRLQEEWRDEGVTIASLDDYYFKNDQTQFLLDEGYSMEEIGLHAGIRDTSEMLKAFPTGVRLKAANRIEGMEPGFSGHADKASAKIGKKMLELKIKAAIAQIQGIRGAHNKLAQLR